MSGIHTAGTHAMRTRVIGSQPQRPRPEVRSIATTPAMRNSQLRYPRRTEFRAELDTNDHLYIATDAVEQWGPSAADDGNGTLWPILVMAPNAPETSGHNGAMNGPGWAIPGKEYVEAGG